VPRFYFDLDDGFRRTIDDEGIEAATLEEAKKKAVQALPGIARDVLPSDVDRHVIEANVRDESGAVRVRATLTLMVEASPD
jgi:hypothetical protein